MQIKLQETPINMVVINTLSINALTIYFIQKINSKPKSLINIVINFKYKCKTNFDFKAFLIMDNVFEHSTQSENVKGDFLPHKKYCVSISA